MSTKSTIAEMYKSLLLFVVTLFISAVGLPEALTVTSPDSRLQIQFSLQELDATLTWSVHYDGRVVLQPSALALELEEGPDFRDGFKVRTATQDSHDETWNPVYGERAQVRDHYQQLVIDLQDAHDRHLQLTFRAYNAGAAVCYTFPEQNGLDRFTITREHTQFRFTGDHPCYPVYAAQGEYKDSVPLSQVKRNCERPLTLVLDSNLYVAVGEARLVDYARMRLQPVPGKAHALESDLAGEVELKTPYTTPWRFVMVAESPGQLLEQNDLVLNLNDPCAIKDTRWIKPGKVMREVTLSTEGGMACIDFAAEHNIQYIEYDAGWYGPENEMASDATTITKSIKKSGNNKPLDLHQVIQYGKERGVGILVYVNRRALEKQLDAILPLYKEWGIKGIKYGFVNVGSQRWTTWLHEAVRKAADFEMMVDVHDEYRPTGYSRTYPNLMTQEGILGNEGMPPARHNTTLPFTRFLCGAGDYTICWYSDRVKNSLAHQLGALIAYYSPLQFVFWYDRPAQYQGEPGVELIDYVPTVWEDTRVLQGKIGAYASIARKSGDDWFVGTLNAGQERRLSVPLDFLEEGRRYVAHIYSDGAPDGSQRTCVDTATQTVKRGDVLEAHMAPNGGQAIRLVLQQ